MKVGVVGLGKLGICMASVYAKHGLDVVGVDINEKTLASIKKGECPVEAEDEKGLKELLQSVPLAVSTDYGILSGSEILIVILPTPSRSDGSYNNEYIISALKKIREVFLNEIEKPVVVIKSTVMPGSCEREFIPLVEDAGIDVCYSAEMVGLGAVVRGLEYPEELLLGERKRKSGDKVVKFYELLFAGRMLPPIRRMSLWNAELSKLALNVFLVSKVTLANTVARLCDGNPTGNIEDVLSFVGNDSRIGTKFLVTGLGMGGVCFPRDSKALICLIGRGNADADIPLALDRINMNQPNYIYEHLMRPLPKTVSIFGIAYKSEIRIIEASMVIPLIVRMIEDGVEVKLHDPKGLPNAKEMFGGRIHYASSIQDCLEGSELLVIGTDLDEYKNMNLNMITEYMKSPVVYDCWRIWDSADMKALGIKYHAFGINDEQYW